MRLRILIADDEQLERRALSSIIAAIQLHELELVEASNGRQAVELARTGVIDIAFLDIRMPGMDGLQAAQELKILHPDIRIVFVTAFDHFDYAREAIRLGVDEYLVKPASADDIRNTVFRMADRIVTARTANNQNDQPGKMDRKALALLEDELRSDLARGDMVGKRIASFIQLKGLARQLPVAVIVRFSNACLPESSLRHAQLRRVMDLMEHQLKASGRYILSGTDGTELRSVVIQTMTMSPENGMIAEVTKIKETLQTVVTSARSILGVRIVIGACPFPFNDDAAPATEHLTPFITAGNAVSIASTEQAVVIINYETASPDNTNTTANRQCVTIVERAMAYMHLHLSEDISLADVAAAVGTAPSHLSRLFSRHSGDTFIHVLCRLRVDMAKKLLRTNQYRVKEVYTMVGFNDQAYFSRVFRKYEGTSPQNFRSLPE
jgi:two-component system response regulator YesN